MNSLGCNICKKIKPCQTKFETSKSNSEDSKSNSIKITSFSNTTLQKETFLLSPLINTQDLQLAVLLEDKAIMPWECCKVGHDVAHLSVLDYFVSNFKTSINKTWSHTNFLQYMVLIYSHNFTNKENLTDKRLQSFSEKITKFILKFWKQILFVYYVGPYM